MKFPIANLLMRAKGDKAALEVDEELRFHVEMLEQKYRQQGLSVTEAEIAAAQRFGDLERVKQQCVAINRRSSLPQRVLKTTTLLLALIGLSIHLLSSEYRVARIGVMLITIAIAGRLLLYVRGLSPTVRN